MKEVLFTKTGIRRIIQQTLTDTVKTMLKRTLIFLFMSLMLALPCRAASDEAPLLDAAEVDVLMAPFIEKYELSEKNFGLGFLYTGTDESYYLYGDSIKYAASLFKVPLCMLVAEKVSSGELSQTDSFADIPIDRIEEGCIIASNNHIAATVLSAMEPYAPEKLTSYCGMAVESLPPEYRDQYYTPRFMVNTLKTLYDEPARFPNIIECMLLTQPEEYFRLTLEGRWDVAQKYGQTGGALNNAGIIYTPTPIILVVMTNRVDGNMQLIGELAELFAEYSLTLDARAEERLAAEEAARRAEEEAARRAQEEAAAEAERQRLAAEEEARREAERIAEEERLAALRAAEAAEAAKRMRQIRFVCGAGFLMLAVMMAILLLSKGRK